MSEPEGASILLIEDEPQIRRFLRASLGAQGYRLVEAVTGEDGLLQAATRQPHLVLLDLGPPDLDGVDVIRRLRQWAGIPIIVPPPRRQGGGKNAPLHARPGHYVRKPFA